MKKQGLIFFSDFWGKIKKVPILVIVLLFGFTGWAQEITITGVVTDAETNEPLPGANIIVKGTNIGQISDFDGNFNITVPSTSSVLEFTFMGFITQDIVVGNNTTIHVVMQPDAQSLEEVVVVGYGTKKKANLTGAVQQISSKELEDRVVIDPVKALQGAVPGLNISYSSGQVNATPNINIRGFESLSGGSPLIIIDGVPSNIDQFTELNPSDVASVTTLMDAASAAIYGARAAFGVILVTTKSASHDKLNVSYDMNVSLKNPIYIPKFELDPYIVYQQRQLGTGGWYTLIDDWDELKERSEAGIEVVIDPENPDYYQYYGRTNWYDEAIQKNSLTQTHNLSLSGRNEKVNYYLSGGYTKAEGMFKYGNDIFDKYNLRTKLDFKVTDWLTISNNSSYNANEYDEPSQGFNVNNLYHQSSTDVVKNPDGTWTNSGASLLGAASEGGRRTTSGSRFSTLFTVKASFWEDLLTITGRANFMRGTSNRGSFKLPVEYNTGPEIVEIYHPTTEATREAFTVKQNDFDLFADLDKSFGDHNLHLLVGYNQVYRYDDWFLANRKDLISGSVPSLELATGDREVRESVTDWATRSGFFRVSYNYLNKYLIEVNGRYDGTSRFPEDDRFGFFPSVSVGWNVAKEDFWSGGIENIISTLKPRFSYGSLGNQDVGAYAYLPTMSSGKTSSIITGEQQTTLYAPGLVSSSLTWETVQTINFGLDFGFFKNRLTGTTNYYERSTLDMLTKSKQLPGVLGTSEPQDNAADLITKGWDLSLSWRDNFDLSESTFSYNLGVILADSRTWITDFDNPNGNLSDYYTGYEIGTIWGFESDGLFQTEEEIANHANQSNFWSYPDKTPPAPGDIKFNDLNGDGVIRVGQTVYDLQDQKIIGNSNARYTIGITSGASWKGFDFNMFWQGVMKRDWYPGSISFWGLRSSPWSNLQKDNYQNTWTPETPNAYLPRVKGYAASWWSGAEMLRANTRYLQNAWYMRLKNITFGYSMPSNWTDKVNISKLRFYISAENIVTFSGLTNPNIDPETLGTGYPLQSLYAFGLNLKF